MVWSRNTLGSNLLVYSKNYIVICFSSVTSIFLFISDYFSTIMTDSTYHCYEDYELLIVYITRACSILL